MKINRTGITRIVIELKSIVIKVPNFSYCWLHFLQGLVCNIQESDTYRTTSKYRPDKLHLLCPILWSSWGGCIIVMKKADTKRHLEEVYNSAPIGNIDPEEEVKIRYKEWINAGFGGDDKCANYGYIADKLVKIDYQ